MQNTICKKRMEGMNVFMWVYIYVYVYLACEIKYLEDYTKLIIANIYWHLLCDRYHSKYFTYINLLNPYKNDMTELVVLCLFLRQENRGTERLSSSSKVTCLESTKPELELKPSVGCL